MTVLQLAEEIKFVEKTLNDIYMSADTLRSYAKGWDDFERDSPVYYKAHGEERLRLQYLETVYEQRLDELNNKYGAIDL